MAIALASDRSIAPSGPRFATVAFWVATAAITTGFILGAWQRRWIADDGLIVLRTVRNMIAGNGPVFNVGERVEANTSTVWTYLIYAANAVTGLRLELVALTLAMSLSAIAVVAVMAGSRIQWQAIDAPRRWFLPAGIIVYVALPPAQDFASSGLENGLVIAWVGVLFWLLQLWSKMRRRSSFGQASTQLTLGVAFVAGLGPLVRPEMVLLSVGVLLTLAVVSVDWRAFLFTVVVAGAVPVAYQIWRMSYYALPYPNTAVAKDAGGAKWTQGWHYLVNLASPYWLVVPVTITLVMLAVTMTCTVKGLVRGQRSSSRWPANWGLFLSPLRSALCSPVWIAFVFGFSGVVLLVYQLRVGGDFMHGRTLLSPLFVLLTPLATIPIPAQRLSAVIVVVGGALVVAWALIVSVQADPFRAEPEQVTSTGIVDERQFYIQRTGHRHPILATDYMDFPRMRALVKAVRSSSTGALYVPLQGYQDRWEVIPYDHPLPGLKPYELPDNPTNTVVFLNLGMTSMNLPLDVKVYDTVGLATPIAAHTSRLEGGRIGHDKHLPMDWFLVQTDVIHDRGNSPEWIDENWVNQARVALTCPATGELVRSYTDPLNWDRRVTNLKWAFSFARYRIERIPAYEVQRCGLPMPPRVENLPTRR